MASADSSRQLVWQKLDSTRADQSWLSVEWEVHRSKVPGGWFVITRVEGSAPQGMVYYPDPDHHWDGASIP